MSLEIDKIKALLAKKNQKDYDSGLVSVDDDMDVIDNTHKFNAMSVTEKMMYPAKLIDAWWQLKLQRREAKMPHVGEFIGE